MEKETYTPRHTIRNLVLANLLIYLLMVACNQIQMIIWFFSDENSILFGMDLLSYTLSFALAYPVGAAISWVFFYIDSWIKMAILQVFISNLIIFAICFLPSMDFDFFALILLGTYFLMGGVCSFFVISACYYMFRKSFED